MINTNDRKGMNGVENMECMASGYVCIPDDRCGMVYRPVEGNAGSQSKGYGKMSARER